MKPLLKVILTITCFFAATFVIARLTGFLDMEQIEGWLVVMKESSALWVGVIIALLLLADLFVTVPTMSLTILSGYLLGFELGALAALIGMMSAGFAGYFLSSVFGAKAISLILRKEKERDELRTTFMKHGFTMIVLARAVPMLPEITACLSGMTGMKFSRFVFAWLISAVPYALIAAYSGSVSSLDNPMPAILAAIGISTFLWLSWYIVSKRKAIKA
jgi:uncharacterized membrane protein YdjX (TVP38/TMEM64 family)